MEDQKAIAGFTPGPNFTSDTYLHYPAQAIGARTNVIIDTCENCSLNWLD